MGDWTGGYVADLEYVTGFYREQSPTFLNFVCMLNGYEPLPLHDGFTYCELGCGLGLTVGLLAAADPRGDFVGVDFNPAHMAAARTMAEEARLTNLRFVEASFEELIDPDGPDLPQFDIVTMHGVYSWVTPENRAYLVEFLRRFLKPGGMLYVSYNCQPGWAAAVPVQRMLLEYARNIPDRSDRQLMEAVGFIQELHKLGAAPFTDNYFVERLGQWVNSGEVVYLVHEYLSGGWQPLFHADVARDMAGAKLNYVGAARLLDNFPDLTLTPEQKQRVNAIASPTLKEMTKDYLRPKLMRHDVYVRGARRMPKMRQDDLMRSLPLALAIPRPHATLTIDTPLGQATISEDVYTPVLDALAERPHTLGELIDLPALRGKPGLSMAEIAGMLTGTDQTLPLDPTAHHEPPRAKQFNLTLGRQCLYAKTNTRIGLACSLVSTGIYATVIEALAYLGLESGLPENAAELARFVYAPIAARGENLIEKGEPITDEAQALALLTERTAGFLEHKLPLLRHLGGL